MSHTSNTSNTSVMERAENAPMPPAGRGHREIRTSVRRSDGSDGLAPAADEEDQSTRGDQAEAQANQRQGAVATGASKWRGD